MFVTKALKTQRTYVHLRSFKDAYQEQEFDRQSYVKSSVRYQ